MSNKELFERLTARTLGMASDAFPKKRVFRAYDILQAEGMELTDENYDLADDTLSWLHDERMLSCDSTSRNSAGSSANRIGMKYANSRLTAVGFDALNQEIDVSGQTVRQKVGDVLKEQLKQSAGETRSAVISDMIGRIIGAAAKEFVEGS